MKNIIIALFSLIVLSSCSTKSETITQMVKFTVKPELIQEFKKAQVNSLYHSLEEEGNIEMKLYANYNNPYEFYVYSKWKNQEAYKLHVEMPYSKTLAPLFKKALQKAPDIIRLEDTEFGHINSKKLLSTGNEQAVFIPFKIKEAYKDRVIKQLEKQLTNSRKEEGNIFFDFYAIEGQENTFYIYGNWKNSSAFLDIHNNQLYTKETLALLNEAVEGGLDKNIELATEYD